ncbi:MAG: pyrroline-5-carboxylate reductase [Candidatus Dasytiphilus stammeri]
MMKKKLGFIGGGHITQALIGGIVKSKIILPANIYLYDCNLKKMQSLHKEYGINLTFSEQEVSEHANILFLAVKAPVILNILKNKITHLDTDLLVVSLATGISLQVLASLIGDNRKIIRVMPNLPVLVREGMISITPNTLVTERDLQELVNIFNSIGRTAVVPEKLIHTVVGVSSSAPAYVYMFIEAMADAAVLSGMSRNQAYQFTAQAVKGAAQMVLETNQHPAVLKDEVCTPQGTTIEAIKCLEKKGLRGAVMDAIHACIQKSVKISSQ